jgi:N-acetylmuramoyl-L-alanine amidase
MNGKGIKPCQISRSVPAPKRRRYLPRTMRLNTGGLSGVLAIATMTLAACAPATSPVSAPEPVVTTPRSTLPPVPLVEGALAPRLTYPQPNQLIQSPDSNFILGSVGNGRATLTVNGVQVRVAPNGAFLAFVPNPPPTAPQYELVATLGTDTARFTQQVRVAGMALPAASPDSTRTTPVPPPPPPTVSDTTPAWVILGDSVIAQTDTDRVIIGRPAPNDTYRWFFLPGTRVQVTARYPGYARIQLDSALQVWVVAADAKTFDADTTSHPRIAGNASVRSSAEWADFVIPIAERVPYFVEERERSIDLTLYDTRGNTDLINYPSSDSLITHVEWAQEQSDRARYTVHLSESPFGYLVLYENGALVLRVRRTPRAGDRRVAAGNGARSQPPVSSLQPLQGITIAVDPGHPPAGATGPTGLYEGDAVLPVGFALKRVLEERGATVVMTRTTRDTVDLAMRPIIARQGGAHAFVSLHYNAYPDGVNPFMQPNGMETFFYRAHSEPLARDVQLSLDKRQPLADEGVHFRSLAVVRSTWMPAILVEGGYIIVPEQENAMRTTEFQEEFARSVADGLESYFRALRSR